MKNILLNTCAVFFSVLTSCYQIRKTTKQNKSMYILTKVLETGADAPTWYKNKETHPNDNANRLLIDALKQSRAIKIKNYPHIEQWYIIDDQFEGKDLAVIERKYPHGEKVNFYIGVTECSATQAISQGFASRGIPIVTEAFGGVTLTQYEVE